MTFSIRSTEPISRRLMLKGAGAAMALPLLGAMGPSSLFGAEVGSRPVRMGFIFFPNGAIMDSWKPTGTESNWKLSETLAPLAKHKDALLVMTGLTQHHARSNGDGGGDHARNCSAYLTGAQPRKTSGADIQVGKSVDQIAADVIGKQTKLPSLELGIERGRNAGSCDSGYSCAYSNNISWKTPSTPMAKEIHPRLAFERLFGTKDEQISGAAAKKRDLYRQSILDLVADDAATLSRKLGKTDQRKLDEYFTSVRELELRIERSAASRTEAPEYDIPEGMPKELGEHIQLMFDLQVLAWQTDATRVSTFMLGNAGSNRTYPEVDVRSGHHSLSHHREDKNKMDQLRRVDKYLVSYFGQFLDKLAATKDGDSRLIDNCMVMYGSAISDGNRHRHEDLPIVLAGRGGGQLKTGRFLNYKDETPLNNLFLSMLSRAGAKTASLGNSTGELDRLS